MPFIKLNVAGRMMSFGEENSSFPNKRYTQNKPTKNAIIGMICSAFGYDRYSDDCTRIHSKITMIQTTSMLQSSRRHTDYQNAQFHTHDRLNGDIQSIYNIQRYKEYIINGEYMVLVYSDDIAFLQEVIDNLKHPVWSPYIGRKKCIPSKPVISDFNIYDDIKANDMLDDFNNKLKTTKQTKGDHVKLCICQ